jgi:hypothetical protein
MLVLLANPTNPLMHSEKLFLVDGAGQVRLLAEAYDSHDIQRLIDGATALSTNSPATMPSMSDAAAQAMPATQPAAAAPGAIP